MEGLPLFKSREKSISIQASKGTYEVFFTDNVTEIISNNFKPGDQLIIDQNFADLHPSVISLDSKSHVILI